MEFLGLKPEDLASAILTGVVTFLIFMGREFWEKRKADREKKDQHLDIFRMYGYPLIIAAESLVNRLHEMFETKPRFLRKDAPDIEFYQYNYISTLYRLCAVLGWIRAVRREVASLDVGGDDVNEELENAITNFQDALASNHFTSGKQVDYLTTRWELDISNLDLLEIRVRNQRKRDCEQRIEKLVWEFLAEKRKTTPHDLKAVDQLELLKKVFHLLSGDLEATGELNEDKLAESISSNLAVVSRRVSWIYRDWQRAIGDYMLGRVEDEVSARRLELMPFHEFEELYLDYLENPEDHRYLGRIDRLFSDLRLGSAAVLDVRSEQLKVVSTKLVRIIEAIWKTGIGNEAISRNELEAMKEKNKKIRSEE